MVKQSPIDLLLHFQNIYDDLQKSYQLLDNNEEIKIELNRLTKNNSFLNTQLNDAIENITKLKKEHENIIKNNKDESKF